MGKGETIDAPLLPFSDPQLFRIKGLQRKGSRKVTPKPAASCRDQRRSRRGRSARPQGSGSKPDGRNSKLGGRKSKPVGRKSKSGGRKSKPGGRKSKCLLPLKSRPFNGLRPTLAGGLGVTRKLRARLISVFFYGRWRLKEGLVRSGSWVHVSRDFWFTEETVEPRFLLLQWLPA